MNLSVRFCRGITVIALAALLLSFVAATSLQHSFAQNVIPVKILVSKGKSTNDIFTIKVKFSNPAKSGYSIKSVDITLDQEISKYKTPAGWTAKDQKDSVTFTAKSSLKPGRSVIFEISSPLPIYDFKWKVASAEGNYVDSGTKNTNIKWPIKDIEREYKWTFEDKEWTWNPVFSRALYDYYKNKSRPPTSDYSIYVTDPYDDVTIGSLVERIREAAVKEDWSEWQTINFVISFVQSLPYTPDNVTTAFDEYPRYPIETLVDNGGDCEDTSILTVELIRKLGYGTILISPPGHMAVGVYCTGCDGSYYEYQGKNYYYLESTGEGWEIGQIPDEYQEVDAKIYPLVAKPIITFEWTSKVVDFNDSYVTYKIDLTIENEGSDTARNLKVWTGFETVDESNVWTQITTEPADLDAGASTGWEITLSPPRDKYTRLHIQLYGDNFDLVESYSKWFTT